MAKMQMSGVVTGNKMEKTVVVEVGWKQRHPQYKKVMNRKTKVYAHTEELIEIGTEVLIEETRPISKLKRWKVVKNSDNTSKE